jgi:hypothetical protein
MRTWGKAPASTCELAVDCSGKTVQIMAAAGYSGTPLIKKLGINPGLSVKLIHQPDNYFDLLESDISDQVCDGKDVPDLVHLFVLSNKEFESEIKKLRKPISQNPNLVIWVSWYKKSAGIATDVTEDVIRNYALRNGLVDVKVCAVSEVWSGLKLVVPLAKRKSSAKQK